MGLLDQTRADVAGMIPEVRDSALAQLAILMAEALEGKPGALMAGEFRQTMDRLRELSPPAPKKDALDELRAKRAERRGA